MSLVVTVLLAAAAFHELAVGLDYGEFEAPVRSTHGDSVIRVVRVDPKKLELRLVSAAAEPDKKARSARQWARDKGALAVLNASMFQRDYLTSIALLRTEETTNNAKQTGDKSFLVIAPRNAKLAPARLLDRECDDVKKMLPVYKSVVQDIRMLSCKGQNVWKQQPGKSWSIAAIGEDKEHRVLLLHSRSPFTVHDFVDHVRALPLGVERLMYADGGWPAQLYVNAGGTESDTVGGYNLAAGQDGGNGLATPLPNVLAVFKRP